MFTDKETPLRDGLSNGLFAAAVAVPMIAFVAWSTDGLNKQNNERHLSELDQNIAENIAAADGGLCLHEIYKISSSPAGYTLQFIPTSTNARGAIAINARKSWPVSAAEPSAWLSITSDTGTLSLEMADMKPEQDCADARTTFTISASHFQNPDFNGTPYDFDAPFILDSEEPEDNLQRAFQVNGL